MLGDSGRSWLAGFGTDYPTFIWHKLSYNSYIDWPTRGVTVFANWSQEQTDGTYKTLLYGPLAKFDMECESAPPVRALCSTHRSGAPCHMRGLELSSGKVVIRGDNHLMLRHEVLSVHVHEFGHRPRSRCR